MADQEVLSDAAHRSINEYLIFFFFFFEITDPNVPFYNNIGRCLYLL